MKQIESITENNTGQYDLKPAKEIYRDQHRDVNVEVSRHWNSDRQEIWCFYLHLLLEQFPEEFHKDFLTEVKTSDFGTMMQRYAQPLEGLQWHSGMTYYELEKPRSMPFHTIKAGCDYNHLWDEGQHYSAWEVMTDAKACVDSLFTAFPKLKTAQELWDEYRAKFKEIATQKVDRPTMSLNKGETK